MRGCLAWIGALCLACVAGAALVGGVVVALAGESPDSTLYGGLLVSGSGMIALLAAGSRRFDRALAATLDPLETGLQVGAEAVMHKEPTAATDDAFHARTGRHAFPFGLGVVLLAVSALMILTWLVDG